MIWREWLKEQLHIIRSTHRWRELVPFDGRGPVGKVNGRTIISFASNDYLGLASHPQVSAAAKAAIDEYGTGATAARLIVGTRTLHQTLERELAEWQQSERALLFPNGFAANLGVLSVLGDTDVTIFSDALNHASMIDGCRLAKARVVIYRHNDVGHLSDLMHSTPGRKLVLTDVVFSMDGDIAALSEIAALCTDHDALLVIDEAHDVFEHRVMWPKNLELVRVGTLSKTLGALGGWVASSSAVIDLLINRSRPFIFTTGLSPGDTAAALAALRVYRSDEGQRLRDQLRAHIEQLKPAHPSPIIPLVLGKETAALSAAAQLFDRGIYIPAIRPPTVPANTARLRIALSAAHTDAMMSQLMQALRDLGLRSYL